jgi:hypothetical protein
MFMQVHAETFVTMHRFSPLTEPKTLKEFCMGRCRRTSKDRPEVFTIHDSSPAFVLNWIPTQREKSKIFTSPATLHKGPCFQYAENGVHLAPSSANADTLNIYPTNATSPFPSTPFHPSHHKQTPFLSSVRPSFRSLGLVQSSPVQSRYHQPPSIATSPPTSEAPLHKHSPPIRHWCVAVPSYSRPQLYGQAMPVGGFDG